MRVATVKWWIMELIYMESFLRDMKHGLLMRLFECYSKSKGHKQLCGIEDRVWIQVQRSRVDINKHVIDSYSLSTVFGKMRCYESGISEKLDFGCICSQMYKQQFLIKLYAEGMSCYVINIISYGWGLGINKFWYQSIWEVSSLLHWLQVLTSLQFLGIDIMCLS